MTHPAIIDITNRIISRSKESRAAYMANMAEMRNAGPARPTMSCGNLAHAYAGCPQVEKDRLSGNSAKNIAIVSAYNDMLSAHQPYHAMLNEVKQHLFILGATAQMAGGVPAMCDGVTQGQPGMELSLFSRDVIAFSTAVSLSHNVYDAGMLLGVCDKIVPGLLMGALSFGHLPFIFVPAGPMATGITNSEKAKVRQDYAKGTATKDDLFKSESKAYHSPGTCTFYGTANSNQVMLEMMGVQIIGSSFVHPEDPLRAALTQHNAKLILDAAQQQQCLSLSELIDEKAIVNGIIGLLATGGSTNHTIHIIAIAAAAGIKITWQDFADLSEHIPLLARVYPNGLADVNAFHAAGGTVYVLKQLCNAGLIHGDAMTITGQTLADSCLLPYLTEYGTSAFLPAPTVAGDDTIVRPYDNPFQATGGLKILAGNLGQGVIKISAVKPEHQSITAPAIVFHNQEDVLDAFDKGELERDFIAVLRFQGPKANGMPELHKLTPSLGVLQDKGFKVALVTDGRMSGASGKVPAAIHMSPEASDGGPLARLKTGDMITLDAAAGTLTVAEDLELRETVTFQHANQTYGRHIFKNFRSMVGEASTGASLFPSFTPDYDI